MPNVMFNVPDPDNIPRLIDLALTVAEAKLVPVHIKEDYTPVGYCGTTLSPSDLWEPNRTWTLATCLPCIQEDARRRRA